MPRLKYFNETTQQWEYAVVGAQGPVGPEGPQGEVGPAGEDGIIGVDGEQGPAGIVAQTSAPTDTSIIWVDTDASAIDIPIGGTAGQALTKIDGTDFNTEWSDIYSQSETDTAISNAIAGLVDTAPAALNTLNELAASLGDDENFAATITTALSEKSDTSHTHDDRYYTETETDNLLNAKASLSGATFTGDISAQTIVSNRINSIEEGGEIQLMRSSDNAAAWKIDAFGAGSQPDLRIFDNGGSVRLRIKSGIVLTEYQPRFQAYGAAGSSGTSGQDWIFPSTYVNTGSYYNTSNGRFTAPVSGVYAFFWSNIGNNQNTAYRYHLRKNGVNIDDLHLRLDSGTAAYKDNGDRKVIINLVAGDYVNIYFVSDNATGSYTVGQYPSFGGYLLG